MVKVILANGLGDQKTVIVPEATTVKAVLKDNNVNAAGKLVYIGSTPITDHSMTFAEIGVTDECAITCTPKADGGLL